WGTDGSAQGREPRRAGGAAASRGGVMTTIGTAGVTGRWSAFGSCRRSKYFCRGSGYCRRGSEYWVLGSGYESRGSRTVLSRVVAVCWRCPCGVSLPLTPIFTPVAPAPAGIPTARAITSRTATVFTLLPLSMLYAFDARRRIS